MPPKGTRAARKPVPKKTEKASTSPTTTDEQGASPSAANAGEGTGESQELASASRHMELASASKHMEEAARAHEILESLPSRPNAVAGGKVIAYFQDNANRGYSQQTLDDGWRDVLRDGFNIDIEAIKASRRSDDTKDSNNANGGTTATTKTTTAIKDDDVSVLVNAFECDKRTANDVLKAYNGNLHDAMTSMIVSV